MRPIPPDAWSRTIDGLLCDTSWVEAVIALARRAGEVILQHYRNPAAEVRDKADATPVTQADLEAHGCIAAGLGELTPDIAVLSEEGADLPAAERLAWPCHWLVDPLDGTREFIARNGEFSVNLALIQSGRPRFGVVHVPLAGISYVGIDLAEPLAFRQDQTGDRTRLRAAKIRAGGPLTLVTSRRHQLAELEALRQRLCRVFNPVRLEPMGSARKICLVAEGSADLYPRFGPTSEWDTAAGQAVLEAAGGALVDRSIRPLRYNQRESLLNPDFFALGDPSGDWRSWLEG